MSRKAPNSSPTADAEQAPVLRDRRLPDRTVFVVLTLAALVLGALALESWTTDDAFISFRYARNLLDGHGLVFNPGERVEAYSNFLWTLWSALGLALAYRAETWTAFWGAASYLIAIGLLALNARGERPPRTLVVAGVPLAALAAALHRDWAVFATSGLETAPYTLLLLVGFLLVTRFRGDPRWLAVAGTVLGLACLTRPDGILPAAVLGAFVLYDSRRRVACGLAYGLPVALLWGGHLAWRLSYYGDLFPNTYYAKSAYDAWYSQGLHYLALYFERYWPTLGGLVLWPAALVAGIRCHLTSSLARRQSALALAVAATYALYVMRVGGDFMFARFLVPTAPFLLVLLEHGWRAVCGQRARWSGLLALVLVAVVLAGMAWMPAPVSGSNWQYGIADERDYYDDAAAEVLDRKARLLARLFADLPVRVAFYGDEARVVYKARLGFAIESHAGLTEPEIARRKLAERGRPGHEKYPDAVYLVERRRANITFSGVPQKLLRLRQYLPEIVIDLGDGFSAQLLRWDPALVEPLRSRGIQVPPFPQMLDRYIATMDRLPDDRVAADYERFRRFYFDSVDDPTRHAAFWARLGL